MKTLKHKMLKQAEAKHKMPKQAEVKQVKAKQVVEQAEVNSNRQNVLKDDVQPTVLFKTWTSSHRCCVRC